MRIGSSINAPTYRCILGGGECKYSDYEPSKSYRSAGVKNQKKREREEMEAKLKEEEDERLMKERKGEEGKVLRFGLPTLYPK